MIRMIRGLTASAVLALAAVSGGCAGYGMEDVYGGRGGWGGSSEMRGQVDAVHSRYHTIRLRRDNGRVADVRYDSRTEVVDRDRRYRAESLDRGDYVTMRVSRDSRGQLYTRHVTVRRNAAVADRNRVPDRRRGDDRWDDRRNRRDDRYEARSVAGRVERVDRSGRRFQLRTDRGNVWVTLPSNAGRGVRERFQRLRTGAYVSVEGRYVNGERFQLERFR
ncbi:OB-fold nucleic acid binding domain-containing protein [Longimicrobium sp.]|uniref:OB-fold nucleic acid binding domain-containing protein n=1 Tax=Longimicrobium sp. TaxID=2029185 RepID=UPI003B3B9476